MRTDFAKSDSEEIIRTVKRVLAHNNGIPMTAEEISRVIVPNTQPEDLKAVGLALRTMSLRKLCVAHKTNRGPSRYQLIEDLPRPRYATGIEFSMAQIAGVSVFGDDNGTDTGSESEGRCQEAA